MSDRDELRIAIAAQRIEIKRIEALAAEHDPFAAERGELVAHLIAAGVLIDCGLGCLGVLDRRGAPVHG